METSPADSLVLKIDLCARVRRREMRKRRGKEGGGRIVNLCKKGEEELLTACWISSNQLVCGGIADIGNVKGMKGGKEASQGRKEGR